MNTSFLFHLSLLLCLMIVQLLSPSFCQTVCKPDQYTGNQSMDKAITVELQQQQQIIAEQDELVVSANITGMSLCNIGERDWYSFRLENDGRLNISVYYNGK